MIKNIYKENKGYTLLFAVLVAAVTLAVGISILIISKKEYLLASTARDSTYAFYVADSGIECAWYYEFENSQGYFATNTLAYSLQCGNEEFIPVTKFFIDSNGDLTNDIYATGVVTFSVPYDNGACAYIEIKKWYERKIPADPFSLVPKNQIISRGYNLGYDSSNTTCDPNKTAPSNRKVERALRLKY